MCRLRNLGLGVVGLILAAQVLATELTIGLGTDVTAIDPHYHNVTPNNNVAAHIFGFLVQRNEKSQLEPWLATEWKAVDPLTWEFKLRQRREVPRWLRFHRRRRRRVHRARADGPEQPVAVHRVQKQIKEIVVVDPLTIRFRTATPYPLMPSDMTQVAIVSKAAAKATTDDFNQRQAASARARTGSSGTPRATASSSRATTRTGAARPRGRR